MTDAEKYERFLAWCRGQGFEILPLDDGSGKGYIIDKPHCSRFKMHLTRGSLEELQERVRYWQTGLRRGPGY